MTCVCVTCGDETVESALIHGECTRCVKRRLTAKLDKRDRLAEAFEAAAEEFLRVLRGPPPRGRST